ncbi:MAG: serine/threonine-protein phosphatase [Anaerolineae bacterium]|nr:Serine/threonine phosphatase stp [Anaerolineales bacterium]RIK31283.1 MAG: serine/threonine-protein phosphatase [Anaerolineae bacterium]WKZ44066.1 MAG: protein phosphatase 2C domain-containing protein [Anaerolineales bacterium]WKZ46822.1 MAG: protein phosphatase 2C domain-containing protein [Anaerolineales bacterium]
MNKFFDRLFGKKEPPAAQTQDVANTAPLTEEQIQAIVSNQNPRFDMQQLIASCGQSVGKQRELNEDSILALTTTMAGNSGNLPFGLYIVADGMGGHQFGEVASNAAIRSVAGYLLKKFHPYLFQVKTDTMDESFQEIMLEAVREAQKTIQREAPGSGTTLTAALVIGQQVTVAHVGDSRAYFVFPDGRIEPITRDHSLVKRLEELGHITPEEAVNYPHRNVLYRALGQGELLDPDIFTVAFPQPGCLMICSDGLWGVVAEQDLVRAINEAPNLQRACQNLVSAANTAGGPDNISVILAQLIG